MTTGGLTYQAVLAMVGVSRGKHDSITIPLVFVDWLGSYEAAAMLTQVLYWQDLARSQGKSHFLHSLVEWKQELRLSERRIVIATSRLHKVGLSDSARGHFDGSPMFAYALDPQTFITAFAAWIAAGQRAPSVNDPEDCDVDDPFHGRAPEYTRTYARAGVDPNPDSLNGFNESVLNPEGKARALASGIHQDSGRSVQSLDVYHNTRVPKEESIYNTAYTRTREGEYTYTRNGAVEEPENSRIRAVKVLGVDGDSPEGVNAPLHGTQERTGPYYVAGLDDPKLDPGPDGDYPLTRAPMRIPANYSPGPNLRAWWARIQAEEPGADSIRISLQVGAFINYWTEKRRTTTDIDALFRNWMIKKVHYKQTDHSGGSGKKRTPLQAPITAESYEAYMNRTSPPKPPRLEPAEIYEEGGIGARKMRASDVPRDDVEQRAEMEDEATVEERIKYAIREAGLALRDTLRLVSQAERALELFTKRDEPVSTFVTRIRVAVRAGARDVEEVLAYLESGAV